MGSFIPSILSEKHTPSVLTCKEPHPFFIFLYDKFYDILPRMIWALRFSGKACVLPLIVTEACHGIDS